MTKLDRTVDEQDNKILDQLHGLYDNSQIRNKIVSFAELAKLNVADVYPIVNYEGPHQDRDAKIDCNNLNLIVTIIKQIETDFSAYNYVRVFDQNNIRLCTEILPSLEIYLAQFKLDLTNKYRATKKFIPDLFCDANGDEIDFSKEKDTTLESIIFNKDGNIYSVKVKNIGEKPKDISAPEAPSHNVISSTSEKPKKYTIKFIGIEREEAHPRFPPSATLQQLREELQIDPELKFRSKDNTLVEHSEESKQKLSEVADASSKIEVTPPGDLIKVNYNFS